MQGTMPQTSELYHAKRAKYWNIIPFQKMAGPPGGGNRMLRRYFENVIPIACNCFCELRSALRQQDATEETHRSKYFNRLEIPASGSRSSKTFFFLRKLLSRIVTIHRIHFLAEEPLAVSMHPDHSWQIIRRPCVTISEGVYASFANTMVFFTDKHYADCSYSFPPMKKTLLLKLVP